MKNDLILLALDCADLDGLDPVQLQKTIFIFCREMKIEEFNFIPESFGPFDVEIFSISKQLATEGLIRISFPKTHYYISSNGRKHIQETKEREYMQKLVSWVQQVNFFQLLSTVYEKYPEMAKNAKS